MKYLVRWKVMIYLNWEFRLECMLKWMNEKDVSLVILFV